MTDTTLCYIEQNGCWLLLHRTKKKNDLNEGKWIGVGGHVEPGETVGQCVRREVLEETGLTLGSVRLRGVVDFISDRWEDEAMYLYTSDDFTGTLTDCSEGVLKWVPKEETFSLPLWEGDRVFLNYLLEDRGFFHLRLHYDENDILVSDRLYPPLILASASPRRRELLEQIGLHPAVVPASVDEAMEGGTPGEIVSSLSSRKAAAAAAGFHGGEVILGADTVVVLDGEILGKPRTHEEAADMIRRLQGKTHEVYTGVTLIRTAGGPGRGTSEARVTFAERTLVRVYPMTEEEIGLYANSGEPMDKAGAYGIQGPFAAFIEGIDGDYTNVVGLPVGKVFQELKKLAPEHFAG